MNQELISEIEKLINPESPEFKKQVEIATQDFREYCLPGGVNNWQHPEKPPIQAGLALACKILKPKRILDMGTGLTGLTFRKYSPESESFLVESDPIWLLKLKHWLILKNLPADNLWYYDDFAFSNLDRYLSPEIQNWILNNPKVFAQAALDQNTQDETIIRGIAYNPPVKYNVYFDTTAISIPEADDMNKVTTVTYNGYFIDKQGQKEFSVTKDPEPLFPWTIGKFDFIHYDFGGMYVRTAYLRLAIDLLDRTRDSVIYIDDLHKKEVLLEGKRFEDLVKEIIQERGGVWLNCDEALVDFQGGRGSLVYFPPLENEE